MSTQRKRDMGTTMLIFIPVLCCVMVSVAWNIQPVFGESSDIVNILNDIRNELDSVKLINERYGERIMFLENQVNECNMKYVELTNEESTVAQIMDLLANIEYQIEANNKNVLERLDALETPPASEYKHNDIVVDGRTGENKLHVDVDTDQNSVKLELTETMDRHSSIQKRIIPVTRHNEIAFTAFLRIPNNTPTDQHSEFRLQVPAGAILPFDNVVLNEGQGFDPTTHVFTCPVSGVYYFSHSIATDSSIVTEMVRDGSTLTQLASWDHLDQGSHPVLTICNEGDEVFVRMSNESRDDLFDFQHFMHDCHSQKCNVDKFISFIGYLLW